MSRTIKTIHGEEIVGLKGSFRDEGDFIVKKGMFGGEERIRKNFIVSDTSVSTTLEVGVAAAGIGLAIAAAAAAEKKRY